MAKFKYVTYSKEAAASASAYATSNTGSFSFDLSEIKDKIVTDVIITAPINRAEESPAILQTVVVNGMEYRQGWSVTDRWSVSGLSMSNVTSAGVNFWASMGWASWGRATITVFYESEFTADNIAPLSGDSIPKSLENVFSWSTAGEGTIVSSILYWKYAEDETYNEIPITGDANTYLFPAYYFHNGNINWYVQSTDEVGNVAESKVELVTVGITPSSLDIAYPKDVNIRNANAQIFTWELTESIATGQKSYEIQYKAAHESNWTVVSNESPNQYHEFAPNTFNTDSYDWKLRVTNNDDITTDFVSAAFVAIGDTDAPDIKEITNSAIPTVKWEISSQDTFEMEIFAGDTRLYTSGVQVGAGVRAFTPNIMLEDGNYIVKMRAMNEYGYFTDWVEYSFVLNAEKPESVECIAYANEYHGVNITKGDGNAENLFVLRREFGVNAWKIMGKLKNNEIFIDNTPIKNKKYEYALRNHKTDEGFADSNIVSMVIDYNGLLIYDGNEFVQLYKTEDSQFDIAHTPSKNYSYSYTIGRKYPVRESSEWMSHSVSLSCFVLFEDYKKLEAFYDGNDDLWFKDKEFSFKCAIDGLQIKETLLGKGYSISIELSRTDENEVDLIE